MKMFARFLLPALALALLLPSAAQGAKRKTAKKKTTPAK